jgi:hypothetical protein
MSNITIAPSMTVLQIAALVESLHALDTEVYVRIESVHGKPVAFLVREVSRQYTWIPPISSAR